MDNYKFSVLMSIYAKDDVALLNNAINSIYLDQTLKPTEIVIVKDGPVSSEINSLLDHLKSTHGSFFQILQLAENVGLGKALNYGLNHCKYTFVARMDSDDISYPQRFEKQLKFLVENKSVAVVGASVEEFEIIPKDLNRFRSLPLDIDGIRKFAKFRNPLNHPTVVFKKQYVQDVGSYLDMPLFEDYYLWVRLLESGCIIANLDEPLLHFRIGNDMIGRRHGYQYLKKEINFLKTINKSGFINHFDFLKSCLVKAPLRLMPKPILKFIYKTFLR